MTHPFGVMRERDAIRRVRRVGHQGVHARLPTGYGRAFTFLAAWAKSNARRAHRIGHVNDFAHPTGLQREDASLFLRRRKISTDAERGVHRRHFEPDDADGPRLPRAGTEVRDDKGRSKV